MLRFAACQSFSESSSTAFDAGIEVAEKSDSTTSSVDDAGLRPCPKTGACTRYVFVTTDRFTGNLGGLSGADKRCNDDAAQSVDELVRRGKYVAWLSNSGVAGSDRISNRHQYIFLNTDKLNVFRNGLGDLDVSHPINLTTGRVALQSQDVWTGTDKNGAVAANTCKGWTSDLQDVQGKVGTTSSGSESNSKWTDFGELACNGMASLYCFEL